MLAAVLRVLPVALQVGLRVGMLTLAVGPITAAEGAWVTTPPVDTDPRVVAVGGVALASDGGGALVELKRDDAGAHVGVATLVNGVWQAPERVDVGQDGSSAQPVVSVRDGGGLIVAWVNQGALYAAARATAASPLGPPTLVYRDPRPDGVTLNPSLSLSVNGAGYLGFTAATTLTGVAAGGLAGLLAPGATNADPSLATTGSGTIRLARFDRTSWSVLAAPLNLDPSHDAGRGANRSAVAAGADGTAVVAWGEVIGAASQVFIRRVDRDSASAFPQQASVPALAGHPGGSADSPSLGLRYDASFGWVVLRQDFDDGGSPHGRVIARHLVGNQLAPPVTVDGLAFGPGASAGAPALAIDGRGRGFAVAGTQADHAVVGAHLNDAGVFGPGLRIDSTASTLVPAPAVAQSAFDSQVIGWKEDPGTGASVHARIASRGVLGAEAVVSTGALDPAGGLGAGMDRYGDAALTFVEGLGAGRHLAGALYAQPPTVPHLHAAVVASRNGHPSFAWRPSFVEWGGPTYEVDVGRRGLGSTRGLSLTSRDRIPEGKYVFRVVARDRFGQASASGVGRLVVDSVSPKLSVQLSGSRSVGAAVTMLIRVGDRAPSSGLRRTRVAWGDGTVTLTGRRAAHAYARPGIYRVRVVASDKAGNARVRILALTIA